MVVYCHVILEQLVLALVLKALRQVKPYAVGIYVAVKIIAGIAVIYGKPRLIPFVIPYPAAFVAEIKFRRNGITMPARFDGTGMPVRLREFGMGIFAFQKLLDKALRLVIIPLARMIINDVTVYVNQIFTRPVLVGIQVPYIVIVIKNYRILKLQPAHRLAHRRAVPGKTELGRMNADNYQSHFTVTFMPLL